ncbi:receptor kinase 3 [Quillaja saponaria]|uniref:non-specific serine/threonine protein kinase n=1 Tax=Quillaja saponaria TaxID=32244 RepID=A0AAD7KW24_QUISA|nr:receptor kinase 3 [Quillaja saponaria]
MEDLQRDECDKYGKCGPYGSCYVDDPICRCLSGFSPLSPDDWNVIDTSGGCKRNWKVDCKNGDGFLKFEGLKLPDNSQLSINRKVSPNDCEAECFKNCSCVAYTTLNIFGNGSTCLTWCGDLMDMRNFPRGGEEIYIRMARAELAIVADARRRKKIKKIVEIVISTVSGLFLLGFIDCCTIMKAKRKGHSAGISINAYEEEHPEDSLELPYFDLHTISASTNNFSSENKIGEGGYGPVYKGVLADGWEIAVKRLANNSSLDQARRKLLTWKKRFDIILGVARGLVYLHQNSRLRIVQRDLKTSNVLLDAEMFPKISDFGVARNFGADQTEEMTKKAIGTCGYMSPGICIIWVLLSEIRCVQLWGVGVGDNKWPEELGLFPPRP